MKTEMKTMSSVDITACVDELRKEIVGGRVEKVYHYPPDEIRIKIYSRGRKDLVIEAGRRIHLTRFPRESPKLPSAFAMLLRKHLEGLRISNLSQYDFDRVVVMEFDGRERRILISELFLKGNIILCDEDLKVIMDLRQNYKRGERYVFPEKRINPLEISLDVLRDLCNDEKEIVKVLAVKCGLGGTFSEEICLRAGIDKNKKAKELDNSELRAIFEKICDLFGRVKSKDFKAYIVVEESRYIDVLPIELEIYSGYEKRFFEKFNDALDEFYSKTICEQIEKTEKESEKLKKLKKRLSSRSEYVFLAALSKLRVLCKTAKVWELDGFLEYLADNLREENEYFDDFVRMAKDVASNARSEGALDEVVKVLKPKAEEIYSRNWRKGIEVLSSICPEEVLDRVLERLDETIRKDVAEYNQEWQVLVSWLKKLWRNHSERIEDWLFERMELEDKVVAKRAFEIYEKLISPEGLGRRI